MLRVRLFGALKVELNGAVVDSPGSQRPWAVFAYLALAGRPVSRGELVSRFWPDVLDQSARASLRSALWALRRQLGSVLAADGDLVALRDDESVWVDLHEFEQLAEKRPLEALELSRGELLEGLEDEWALLARQRHRERLLELLERLAQEAESEQALDTATELTRRQVDLDPLDEQAGRRLMTRLEAGGDRAGAVRTFRALSERLRRELGVAPSQATRELAASLQDTPAAPRPRPAPAGALPLLGRNRELAALERAWQATVTSRRGAAVVVRGAAGFGKTRLASELGDAVAASGGWVAGGAALDLGGSAPLSLWAELSRELMRVLPAPGPGAMWPADLSVLSGELPAHFAFASARASAIAPELARTRLFEAVVALLGWAAELAPLLVVMEDVHAADAPSLELMGYAGRRLASLPVMLLLTRRGLPHNAHVDRLELALRARGLLSVEIELAPLPPDAVAALARRVAELDTAEVARIVEMADGNPLLALETARAAQAGHRGIAPTLRGAVRAALGPLARPVRDLVEVLAVAARPVQAVELRALEPDSGQSSADEALETGLLVAGEGRIGFRHALLREAVYAEIPDPRCTELHHRWARTLLAADPIGGASGAAEVAHHLRRAHADAQAVPHLTRAAAAARGVGALTQAIEYIEEALAIAPSRSELWLELGELEAWRGRRPHAEAAFDRALALLADAPPLEQARACLRRARAYHGPICVPRAVRESAAQAAALLERCQPAPASELSEALAAWAWAEAVAGSVTEAERLLARVSAQGGDRGDLGVYDVAHARAVALMRRGRFAESYGPSIAAGEAISRAERPDLAYGCWANAASAANAAGEPERALEFIDRGMNAVAGRGLQSLEVHLLAAQAFVLRGLGRLADARAAAEAEAGLAEQLGAPELQAMSAHDLGQVALEAGDYQAAAGLLAASLLEGAPISRPLTRLALAEALVRGGEAERSAGELRATVLEPVGSGDFPAALVPKLARVQGLVALARGRPDEARTRLEEAIAGWERLLASGVRADSVTTVLADLGRPVVGLVEPERELAKARTDLEHIGSPEQGGAVNAVVP